MIELLQFRHSPYNEKVRWALDLKRVPHRRRSLLPGPHAGVVKRLTGRTETPVLLHDGTALGGSANILEWLESHQPQPALWPRDMALREEALRIQSWFDDHITPRIRRTVLDALLRRPMDFANVFGDGRGALQRAAYACIVPLAARLVRKGNGIAGDESVQDGHRAAEEAFDFVAGRGAASGYLCGDAFSLADLTVASTLAVLVPPENSPMSLPHPTGPVFQALVDRYAGHPGAGWVRSVYARHRGALTYFDGSNAP